MLMVRCESLKLQRFITSASSREFTALACAEGETQQQQAGRLTRIRCWWARHKARGGLALQTACTSFDTSIDTSKLSRYRGFDSFVSIHSIAINAASA